MQGKVEEAVMKLVIDILGGTPERTPAWLMRPGPEECGARWRRISEIYRDLTGNQLPGEMPARERRRLDCVLRGTDSSLRIIEFDESQHFNCFRAKTLRMYPRDLKVAFERNLWIEKSEEKTKLEGVGFGKPKHPLFPDKWGRHQQRAFRDALTDILPPEHGFLPTLRIGDFEVADWLETENRSAKMKELLNRKFSS